MCRETPLPPLPFQTARSDEGVAEEEEEKEQRLDILGDSSEICLPAEGEVILRGGDGKEEEEERSRQRLSLPACVTFFFSQPMRPKAHQSPDEKPFQR